MTTREIDGFTVEAITVQHDSSGPYFNAAVRVRREDRAFDETHILYGENYRRQSQQEAQDAADAYLATVMAVNHYGQTWDRPGT